MKQCQYRAAEAVRSLRHWVLPVGEKNRDHDPFEQTYRAEEDPWNYTTSPYELVKYQQTLAVLPTTRFRNTLELACAEGVFTRQLAPYVENLVGADISPTALQRAGKRCRDLKLVRFLELDLLNDSLPGRFDLVVCSEILYFMGSDLARVAHKLANGLSAGGFLLMTHMNLLKDDPDQTGFDWNLDYGARVIGEVFEKTFPLRLVKEVKYPLYRIHLLQRQPLVKYFWGFAAPELTEITEYAVPLSAEVEKHVRWNHRKPKVNGTTLKLVRSEKRVDGGKHTSSRSLEP